MNTSIADQITFVHKLATDESLRKSFLKDPAAAEKTAGVKLDSKLQSSVSHTLTEVNERVSSLAHKNPFTTVGGIGKAGFNPGQVMNVVLEAAAVVAAAAAVVTAVTAVYNSVTKNLPEGIDQAQFTNAARTLQNQVQSVGSQVAAHGIQQGRAIFQ